MAVVARSVAPWRVFLFAVILAGIAGCGWNRASREELSRQGDQLFARQQFVQSATAYRQALDRGDEDATLRFKLARSLARAGNSAAAVEQALRAATLLPHNVEAQVLAASQLLARSRFPEAGDRASAILSGDPTNAEALMVLANATAHMPDSGYALFRLADARDAAEYERLRQQQVPRDTTAADDARAEVAARKAVSIAPDSPDALLGLANLLWAIGRRDEGEPILRKFADMAPGHAAGNQALASLYLARHQDADAEHYLKNAAGTGRFGRRARAMLMDLYTSRGRAADAAALLKSMSDEEATELSIELARLEMEQGKYSEAARRVDAVIARNRASKDAMPLRADVAYRQRDYAKAIAAARIAKDQDPNNPGTWAILGRALLATGDPQGAFDALSEAFRLEPESPTLPMDLTRVSLALGRDQVALQFAREAVRKNPGSREAGASLVRTLIYTGDHITADQELKRLLARFPDSPDLLVELGAFHRAHRNSDAARQAFARALQLDPESFDALSGAVLLDLDEQRIGAARDRAERAVAAHQGDPRFLLLAARAYAAGNENKPAEAALQQVLQVDPSNEDAAVLLSQLLVRDGHVDDARRVLDAIVAHRPKSIGARTALAVMLDDAGRTREAQAAYEAVLAEDPDAAVASYRLAALHVRQDGNLDVALRLVSVAKQKMPDDPAVSDLLGWIYTRRSVPASGVPHLEDAVRRSPENPVYRYHLGTAYLDTGKRWQGHDELTRALQLDPNFPGADQARATLAAMNK